MSTEIRTELRMLLVSIERELRRVDAWESVVPAPERLASAVPFCHDTLEFTQWLQWIFIPRLRALLEGAHALPRDCAIAPIAEDALAQLPGDTGALLEQLRRIDRLLTDRTPRGHEH